MDTQYQYIKDTDKQPQPKNIALPVTALALDFAPALLVLLFGSILPTHLLLFMLFIAIISPFVGIILGIVALCLGKKRIGKGGVVISSLAVALPILIVLTVILLIQTGVMVISLM